MGRPSKFTSEQILDASLALVNHGGPSKLTITSAAKALGAPSGSIYHRFASRDILVASLWMRAVERFQAGLFVEMAGPDPIDAVVSAARYVVRFSREDFDHARLLLVHRSNDLLSGEWPDELVERNHAQRQQLHRVMSNLFTRLGANDQASRQRVKFAIMSIPYGAVRGALGSGARPDHELEDLVAEAAAAVLRPLLPSGDESL